VAELGFATAHAELPACSGLRNEAEMAECDDAGEPHHLAGASRQRYACVLAKARALVASA
jgi:hypothetical protein